MSTEYAVNTFISQLQQNPQSNNRVSSQTRSNGQGYLGLFRAWLTFRMEDPKKVKGHGMG